MSRVLRLKRAVQLLALDALQLAGAGTQRLTLEAAEGLTRSAWFRADSLAPTLALQRAQDPTALHPPAVSADTLRAWHRLQTTAPGGDLDALQPAGVPSEMEAELFEHFARLCGDEAIARDAADVRLAGGAVATFRVWLGREAALVPTPRAPGEVWDHLVDSVTVLWRDQRLAPLAPLVAFALAESLAGFGAEALESVHRGELPMVSWRGAEYLAAMTGHEGARDVVRLALRALGHDVDAFTNAERARRRRSTAKRRRKTA